MKTITAIIILLAMFQNWDRISNFISPPPATAYDANTVILYSTAWCGYCRKARRLLSSKGVAYEERDIEKSSSASREHKQLGGRGVPLLLINGTVVKGYSEGRILSLLNPAPHN